MFAFPRLRSTHRPVFLFLVLLVSTTLGLPIHAQPNPLPFSDRFVDRGTLTTPSGSGAGSNVGASLEPREPRHGSVPGGRSVWLTWTPPADGVASLSTAGSSFDTILAVYAYESELKGEGAGPRDPDQPFDGLREIIRDDDEDDDDDSNSRQSAVQFGVRGGVRYAIAVDGFAGASGSIALSWSLLASANIVPTVLLSEPDRALRSGDTLTLSVEVVTPGDDIEFEWYRDDDDLDDEEEPTLVIPNFTAADVGSYRVLIKVGDVEFFSAPVEIQVNSEGEPFSLARDKAIHALESALIGSEDPPSSRPPAPA